MGTHLLPQFCHTLPDPLSSAGTQDYWSSGGTGSAWTVLRTLGQNPFGTRFEPFRILTEHILKALTGPIPT